MTKDYPAIPLCKRNISSSQTQNLQRQPHKLSFPKIVASILQWCLFTSAITGPQDSRETVKIGGLLRQAPFPHLPHHITLSRGGGVRQHHNTSEASNTRCCLAVFKISRGSGGSFPRPPQNSHKFQNSPFHKCAFNGPKTSQKFGNTTPPKTPKKKLCAENRAPQPSKRHQKIRRVWVPPKPSVKRSISPVRIEVRRTIIYKWTQRRWT